MSCTPTETIRIRVTPTPDQTAIAQAAEPTTEVEQVASPTDETPTDTEIVPIVTDEATATITPIPATGTPIQTDGSFGPIIEPDYTPPPTSTPIPTDVPSVTPSVTPIPQTPVTTPLSALPALDGDQMGIQLYYNVDNDQWFQLLRRTDPLSVGWIKVQANWDFLQPNNRDQFDTAFAIFESHIQRAHNDGYQVLVSIAKAPDWARAGNITDDGPPADPTALAYFINFMLDRMGGQISAIEVWNEPNLSREWTGALEWSGGGYMDLFRVAYDAIRARNPNMPIVTAGLAPTSAQGAIDDRLFLQQMYDAGLGDPYYQNIAIGIHPYGWGNPPDSRCCDNIPDRGWDDDPRFFFLNTLEDYRAIMVNNGHQNVQMWGTEFGWATWNGIPTEVPVDQEWMVYNSPQQQSEYTMRAFQIAQELDYVGPMFLWNLNFANETLISERNEMVGYSIFVPGLPIRPIYDAIRTSPRLENQ
ncbi:MAG: cellulase family glycosylhydrolase [Chloroflexota bacterium]